MKNNDFLIDSVDLKAKTLEDLLETIEQHHHSDKPGFSNPYISYRASKLLDSVTLFIWGIVLLLLTGALINYSNLERVEIYATSHDAHIEPTAQPIKLNE